MKKVFEATAAQLSGYSSAQLKINCHDGSLHGATYRGVKTAVIRPGLKRPLEWMGSLDTAAGLLVALSDGLSTRLYLFTSYRRQTLIVNNPCRSHEESLRVLFQALLSVSDPKTITLYSYWSRVIQEKFLDDNIPVSVAVEGNKNGEEFIASVEWEPINPHRLTVCATFDKQSQRTVPIGFHPIEAAYRLACKK